VVESYLLAGQVSELERLQLQSRVWEPAGAKALEQLGDGAGLRVLDIGCGAMGWLRILSKWVGDDGTVVGSDIDSNLLETASAFVEAERLANVSVVEDDLFASKLEPASFDLVHARFQLAPLGRTADQMASYRHLLRDGGTIFLEDPDTSSWRFNPPASSAERLTALIHEAFSVAGGDIDAGRRLPQLLRELGAEPTINAHLLALPAGHPYLRLPLQFAVALEPRLLDLVSSDELAALRALTEEELADPQRWGTTFTLIQAHGKLTAEPKR
jgi:SAM-dependent methyltransferase